jgi:hypothetical protein
MEVSEKGVMEVSEERVMEVRVVVLVPAVWVPVPNHQ